MNLQPMLAPRSIAVIGASADPKRMSGMIVSQIHRFGFKGEVYLLIDRQSYSNTANVAALVQDYGFGKILGEETSDLATTYGAMEQFQLSRTGITVGFPKALIIRPSGNLDPRGVIPDIGIESPLLPGQGDPMLEKALEIVRKER